MTAAFRPAALVLAVSLALNGSACANEARSAQAAEANRSTNPIPPTEEPYELVHRVGAVYVPSNLDTRNDPSPLSRLKLIDGITDLPTIGTSSTLRAKAVHAAAKSAGAQFGLYWRTEQLQQELERNKGFLHDTYNRAIEALLIKHRDYYIVVPVISGTDGGMRKNDTGRVLRIARQTFRIERDPYFVVNPPTWRDYLAGRAPTPKSPPKAMLPHSQEEYALWLRGVEEGWAAGVTQADTIMQVNVARLTRDVIGMARYHMLRIQRMVSPPAVKEVYMPVSGGGRAMSIEDSTISIASDPLLNANRNTWRPMPQLPDTRHLFPEAYLNLRGTTE
ncbi:MAG: hypothetical protein CVV05_00685 [Gammaproteobacteria bacterium HGW-Gammaproteobacteria-1]|jgi:defect-in-organelle-trafficking protein DotC|nr:MAG: hypothetical protein CVV05_00685 [Gammaproteobacteria bacterium HGW-Gammaproteobacteria-1]